MPAELVCPTTVIHRFPTHAARTQRIWPYITVERSEERLNDNATSSMHCLVQVGLVPNDGLVLAVPVCQYI